MRLILGMDTGQRGIRSGDDLTRQSWLFHQRDGSRSPPSAAMAPVQPTFLIRLGGTCRK